MGKTFTVSWAESAILGAEQRLRAVLYSDGSAGPDDVYRINGQPVTWMDLACLVDTARAVLRDEDAAASSADAPNQTVSEPVVDSELRDRLAHTLWERGVVFMSGNQANELADAALAVVAPVLAAKDRLIAQSDEQWEQAEAELKRTRGDLNLLLWLHAEAVWQRDTARADLRIRSDALAGVLGVAYHPADYYGWIERVSELRAERDELRAHGVARDIGEANEQMRVELELHRFKLNDALGIVGAEEDIDPYEAVVALHTEIDRLRAELDRARSFIGEMVLADMEAPLPPYGSEERAEVERPVTEATRQAPRCGEAGTNGGFCDEHVPDGFCSEHGPVGPPVAEPRVWRFHDPEPLDVSRVRDNQGDIWTRMATNLGQLWTSPDTKPFHWAHITKKWGPVTEVTRVIEVEWVVDGAPTEDKP